MIAKGNEVGPMEAAVTETVQSLTGDSSAEAALVELAYQYARAMDAGKAGALDAGPKLVAVLGELLLTPRSRRGSLPQAPEAPRGALHALRDKASG